MDTTSVIDKYTSDLANLPSEIQHIFDELRRKDAQLSELRRKYQARDNQIHKFIRQHGTLARHPKEQQVAARVEEEMAAVEKIQKEKIVLSNTALMLIARHLYDFETDVTRLERDELLPPVDNGGDWMRSTSAYDSATNTPTPRAAVPPLDRKRRKLMKVRRRDSDDDDDSDSGRPDGPHDDADNTLYCFCQRVSFGEMIACDNDDCKYEWFHWSCVGISSTPKDSEVWYCPDCAPKMEKRRKKRR